MGERKGKEGKKVMNDLLAHASNPRICRVPKSAESHSTAPKAQWNVQNGEKLKIGSPGAVWSAF